MSGMFGGGSDGGIGGSLPTGVKMAAIALLAHQLIKHSQAGQSGVGAEQTSGGGLGGLLGSLMGQSSTGSAGMGGVLGGLLGQGGATSAGAPGGGIGGILGGLLGSGTLGGLGGLLGSLRNQGLGHQVDSWVAHGENHPVAPHQLEQAFDPAELDEAARHAGTDRGTLLNEVSRALPGMVDRMTPGGRIPQREEDLGHGGVGGLLGQLLGGGAR